VAVALSNDEQATFNRLSNTLSSSRSILEGLDAYYEGSQRLARLGIAVPPELSEFETVVNWPRMAVDSVEERLDVEGFRSPTMTSPTPTCGGSGSRTTWTRSRSSGTPTRSLCAGPTPASERTTTTTRHRSSPWSHRGR
jgi:hypothetical protein